MAMKINVIWVVMPCSNVVGYQYYRGPFCLHLQGEVHRWKHCVPMKLWYHTTHRHNL